MSETKQVARRIAVTATDLIPSLISDDRMPSINTRTEAQDAIDKVVLKTPTFESKRVWAGVLGIASAAIMAALLSPTTQTAVTAWLTDNTGIYAPVLIPFGAALLAYLSRYFDPRPIR